MKHAPAFSWSLYLPSAALLMLALLPVSIAPKEVLTGWLTFCVLASTIVFGGFFFVLLADIIPGGWGCTVRPAGCGLSRWMPLLALSLLPVLLGVHVIFPWATGAEWTSFKTFYLSPSSFIIRVTLIFLAFVGLSARLVTRRSPRLAIGSLIIFMLMQDFLATDLVLSLDPEFHSSGFGLYLLSIQALTAISVIIWQRLGTRQASRDEIAVLGALLLVMLLCWAYFNFMQYFILWSGNLPSRAQWFSRRGTGFWRFLSEMSVWLRLVPAMFLLFPFFRQRRKYLLLFSAASIVGTVLEVTWLVLPELGNGYGWASFSFLTSCLAVLLLLYRRSGRAAAISAPLAAEEQG